MKEVRGIACMPDASKDVCCGVSFSTIQMLYCASQSNLDVSKWVE